MLIPVVFVHVEREAGFLFHAHNRSQLEEMALMLMSSRFPDSDKSAAVVDESFYCGYNGLIRPIVSAGVSSVAIAHIEDHVDVI